MSMMPGFGMTGSRTTGALGAVYETNLVSTVSGTTHTFTGVPFGDVADNRVIVILVNAAAALATIPSIVSGSIGGIPITAYISKAYTTSRLVNASGALVPTGTTGTVTLTFSIAIDVCAIGVYAIYGLNSAAASSTASTVSPTITTNLSIPVGGAAVAGLGGATYSTALNWVGANAAYDSVGGTRIRSSGAIVTNAAVFGSAATADTVALVGVSFAIP